MFIETALKNIALNTIMTEIDSSSVYDMYDKAMVYGMNLIIPGISEPPVRTLRATIPENERHIFR